jgi:hypothetical protein
MVALGLIGAGVCRLLLFDGVGAGPCALGGTH